MGWCHVDSILKVELGRRAVGERLVQQGGLLDGHFPGRPIQPGVLTLQGLIDVTRHLIAETERAAQREPTAPELLKIEKANFVQTVVPGERLVLEVKVSKWDDREVRLRGTARVAETLKAEAIFIMVLHRHGTGITPKSWDAA